MRRILPYSAVFLVLALAFSNCAKESGSDNLGSGNTGIAGSLARFCIVGNYLYSLDFKELSVFDISQAGHPILKEKVNVGEGAETLFPLNNWLLMGTQTGMLIFEISDNGVPVFKSSYSHVRSCDPVVSDGQFAYVTLRSTGCPVEGGLTDRLEVLDISQITLPELIGSYALNEPYGLGLSGSTLFVCDGGFGIKVFDVSDPTAPLLVSEVSGIDARDVIPLNNIILVISPDNIYQYDASNPAQLQLISLIPFGV